LVGDHGRVHESVDKAGGQPIARYRNAHRLALTIAAFCFAVGAFYVWPAWVEQDGWWLACLVFFWLIAAAGVWSTRGVLEVWPDGLVWRNGPFRQAFEFARCSEFREGIMLRMPTTFGNETVIFRYDGPSKRLKLISANRSLGRFREGNRRVADELNQFRAASLKGK